MAQIRMWKFRLSLLWLLTAVSLACVGLAYWRRVVKYQNEIDQAREAIISCPGPGQLGNPASVIRAVNGLQTLRKADAVGLMRELAKSERAAKLAIIIPLLFPVELQLQLPPETTYSPTNGWLFEYGETRCAGDIPFDLVGHYGSSGYSDLHLDDLLDWCDDFGVPRETPLQPIKNPFEAADQVEGEFVSSGTLNAEELERAILLCRWQAWSLASDVRVMGRRCPPLDDGLAEPMYLLDKAVWDELVREGRSLPEPWQRKRKFRATSLHTRLVLDQVCVCDLIVFPPNLMSSY